MSHTTDGSDGASLPTPDLLSEVGWWHRNVLAIGVVGGVLCALIATAVTLTVVRSVVSPSALLPSVPAGWTRLTTLSGSQTSETSAGLHGVQLRVCWAVQGSGVVSLSYEIGTPFAGPTQFFGNGTNAGYLTCAAPLGRGKDATANVTIPSAPERPIRVSVVGAVEVASMEGLPI
jgi:hypothetical protein